MTHAPMQNENIQKSLILMLNPTKAELVGPQPYPGRAIIGATLAAGSDSPPILTVTSLLLFGLIV